jgi:hypothetical protein
MELKMVILLSRRGYKMVIEPTDSKTWIPRNAFNVGHHCASGFVNMRFSAYLFQTARNLSNLH